MAITFDELVNKNNETESARFPESLEDFKRMRSRESDMTSDRPVMNAYPQTAPYPQPEAMPEQNMRPELRFSEFDGAGRFPAEHMQDFVRPQSEMTRTDVRPQYGYQPDNGYGRESGFLDYNANDPEMKSAEQLWDQLNQNTDTAYTPVFSNPIQRNSAKQKDKEKKISTKGKVIIGLYIAFVGVIFGLVVANASKINAGKATVPSSSIGDYAVVQYVK